MFVIEIKIEFEKFEFEEFEFEEFEFSFVFKESEDFDFEELLFEEFEEFCMFQEFEEFCMFQELEAGRVQLGQADRTETTLDEYIHEVGLAAWAFLVFELRAFRPSQRTRRAS